MTEDRDSEHTPQTFAAWLREVMERRGYAERGGQGRFARDAGVSENNISRIMRFKGTPDVRTLEPIANFLNVPLIEVLVRACVLKPSDVEALHNARLDPQPITTERAAAELGITSPEGVTAFERTVRGLRATEPPPAENHQNDRASG
ncbi:helix-turn-helix transcriptional regulator [Streptomyces sp. NPDC001586]|uniref:helix-turn-helix domain-containing protein n=1 Tax=unclassified Streptomyces TaxID=2593676 RepID=UPI00332E4DBA